MADLDLYADVGGGDGDNDETGAIFDDMNDDEGAGDLYDSLGNEEQAEAGELKEDEKEADTSQATGNQGDLPQADAQDKPASTGVSGDEEEGAIAGADDTPGAVKQSTEMFVSNLQWWTTDRQIEDLLADFGRVIDVRFYTDKTTGKSMGSCVVEFDQPVNGQQIIDRFHGMEMDGKNLKVSFPASKEERDKEREAHHAKNAYAHLGGKDIHMEGGGAPFHHGGGGRGRGRGRGRGGWMHQPMGYGMPQPNMYGGPPFGQQGGYYGGGPHYQQGPGAPYDRYDERMYDRDPRGRDYYREGDRGYRRGREDNRDNSREGSNERGRGGYENRDGGDSQDRGDLTRSDSRGGDWRGEHRDGRGGDGRGGDGRGGDGRDGRSDVRNSRGDARNGRSGSGSGSGSGGGGGASGGGAGQGRGDSREGRGPEKRSRDGSEDRSRRRKRDRPGRGPMEN